MPFLEVPFVNSLPLNVLLVKSDADMLLSVSQKFPLWFHIKNRQTLYLYAKDIPLASRSYRANEAMCDNHIRFHQIYSERMKRCLFIGVDRMS